MLMCEIMLKCDGQCRSVMVRSLICDGHLTHNGQLEIYRCAVIITKKSLSSSSSTSSSSYVIQTVYIIHSSYLNDSINNIQVKCHYTLSLLSWLCRNKQTKPFFVLILSNISKSRFIIKMEQKTQEISNYSFEKIKN